MAYHENAWVFNYKRPTGTDYFITYGSGAARDTTTKDTNADASLSLVYPSGASQTWTMQCQNSASVALYAWRKQSVVLRFYFTANPAVDTIIFQGSQTLYLSTNGKLKINSTESSDAALATSTWHTIEYIEDKDWRSAGSGSILCRQNGGTALQVDTDPGTISNITLGTNGAKSTGPGFTAKYCHIAVLYRDDASNKAPWLNQQTCEQDNRVPIANGTNNDFVGTPQATNKYQNIDETTTDTTDYNYGGQIQLNEKQGSTYTAVTYSGGNDPPRLFSVFNIIGVTSGGGMIFGDVKSLIRDNGVNYTDQTGMTPNTGQNNPAFTGGSGRPADNSALSSTILNNLEGGIQATPSDTAGSSLGSTFGTATADGATYGANWTPSSGTRWSCISDGSDSTYITTSTVGLKYGFNLSYVPNGTAPTLGDTIIKIGIRIRARITGGTNPTMSIGVRIGGVDYDNFLSFTVTSGFADNDLYMSTDNTNFKNPSTGVRFTQTELTTLEWYIKLKTDGGGTTLDVAEVKTLLWLTSRLRQNANFMTVAGGNAFTSNGAVTGLAGGTNVFLNSNSFMSPL